MLLEWYHFASKAKLLIERGEIIRQRQLILCKDCIAHKTGPCIALARQAVQIKCYSKICFKVGMLIWACHCQEIG